MMAWASRIYTSCTSANFIGEAGCVHNGRPRPSDADIDRGVDTFFRCMNATTVQVIKRFLDCLRRGYKVAGARSPLTAVTMKEYTSGLTFLFGAAKSDGPGGFKDVIIEGAGTTTPWGRKGNAEWKAEKLQRADPGTPVGNPMAGDSIRDFRGATHKDARHDGEYSLSAAAVTHAIMISLQNELVVKHLPTEPNVARRSSPPWIPVLWLSAVNWPQYTILACHWRVRTVSISCSPECLP